MCVVCVCVRACDAVLRHGVPSFDRFRWLAQVLARRVNVCLEGGIPLSLRGLTFRVTSQLHRAHAVGNQHENFQQLYFARPRGIK